MEEVLKLFIEWTKVKVRLHISPSKFYCKERQIWWVSLGMNIGAEQNGKNQYFERPVLVLKRVTKDMFLAAPLTTRPKTGNNYFSLTFQNKQTWVALLQIRALSTKRLLRFLGKVSDEDFGQIIQRMKNIL